MSDLYFNGRLWRELLGNEQAVRFLEELYRRAGGAEAPTYTLDETVTQITNVDNSTTQMVSGQDRTRRTLEDLLRTASTENQLLNAKIKRLEHRINQLESELL